MSTSNTAFSSNTTTMQVNIVELQEAYHKMSEELRKLSSQQSQTELLKDLAKAIREGHDESDDDEEDTSTPAVNPITMLPYEVHTIKPGARDIKNAVPPPAFSGHREDARPFLDRVENWFELVPKQYKFTRARILATCALITTVPANSWALAVSKSIRDQSDDDYYTDNWGDFKKSFIASFGVPNEKEDAYNRLGQLFQGTMNLQVFLAEFRRLQRLAELSDELAFREFRRGVTRQLFNQVSSMIPMPDTLPKWIAAAVQQDLNNQEVREFARLHRQQHTSGSHNPRPSYAPAPPVYRPFSRPPQRDPNAMDVDGMSQYPPPSRPVPRVSILPRPATTPRPSQLNPNIRSMGPRVAAPVRDSSSRSSQPMRSGPSSTKPPVDRSTALCHRCARPGHFWRDCKAALNEISEEHICRVMEQAFTKEEGEQLEGGRVSPNMIQTESDLEHAQEEYLEEFGDELDFLPDQ